MQTKILLSLSSALLAVAVPLAAHHGTAVSYDQSKSFSVKATVTEFRYANPHPQIYFDVKDEKGNVVHWSGEIAPNAAQLQQEGWGKKRSEAALAPGTEVTITLAPSRAGTPVGLINKIVGPAGESLLGLTPLGAPAPAAEGPGR
ncbi:MAG: hypothetical protein C5B51_27145 [Terriglobia bacterium]|nr:MAG: hypothetical protein C5B51_27145 [Terriglobia bacterium]